MISFGNAASSHSSLIPLKTSYKKKRGELLCAIVSKKNFINYDFDSLVKPGFAGSQVNQTHQTYQENHG